MTEIDTSLAPNRGKPQRRTIAVSNVPVATANEIREQARRLGLTPSALIRLIIERAVAEQWTFDRRG